MTTAAFVELGSDRIFTGKVWTFAGTRFRGDWSGVVTPRCDVRGRSDVKLVDQAETEEYPCPAGSVTVTINRYAFSPDMPALAQAIFSPARCSENDLFSEP